MAMYRDRICVSAWRSTGDFPFEMIDISSILLG